MFGGCLVAEGDSVVVSLGRFFVSIFCLGVPSICLLCCTREVISRFIPFSVGSHGLLLCVVSLSVILCLMCSGKSLHVLCILPFGM